MLASFRGDPEVVRVLCEAGADKDKMPPLGTTALMLASGAGLRSRKLIPTPGFLPPGGCHFGQWQGDDVSGKATT
eukprot:2101178-Heterocapsa_arctica.AAC.1